jgi:hypothetical protein
VGSGPVPGALVPWQLAAPSTKHQVLVLVVLAALLLRIS